MVSTDNIVKMDVDMLIMFRCPSFEKAGVLCVFSSMKDTDMDKGLRCRDSACEIRLPVVNQKGDRQCSSL